MLCLNADFTFLGRRFIQSSHTQIACNLKALVQSLARRWLRPGLFVTVFLDLLARIVALLVMLFLGSVIARILSVIRPDSRLLAIGWRLVVGVSSIVGDADGGVSGAAGGSGSAPS